MHVKHVVVGPTVKAPEENVCYSFTHEATEGNESAVFIGRDEGEEAAGFEDASNFGEN